jgi:hypothetical protein
LCAISIFNLIGMIVERRVLAIFGLVLLINTVAAIDLSPSTISSSNSGWLIANDGTDQSTITVYARAAGTPATPVTGAKVIFSLDAAYQDLGTLSPVSPAFVLTGSDGKATAVFSTSKKSGNATITATISYDGTTSPVQVVTYQRIDHDTPQGATFENPYELPVGSITQVNVTLVDRWGNRIDDKNTAETIRLTMADDGEAGLQDGLNYITQKSYPTDAEGNVSAVLRISTSVRSNYIQMDPIGNIVVPPGAYIQGVAQSEPYYIAQTPASPGSTLPADGLPENAVEIYYTVTDKYNNPITGASVYCSSSDGMSVTAPTNTWGRLRISFGPKETVGVYTLKAVSLGNTSAVCTGINAGSIGYCSQDVEYYNTDPVDLTLTGNPQSMTSLDVNSSTRSVLLARVIDIKGNPVIGENVTFSLASPTYPGGPYYGNSSPSISNLLPVPVGAGGYATVYFYPGKFAVYGATGYNATATGQVVATATWTNKYGVPITRYVTLVWKNYPYISTSSLGDCGNSQVGDKINITIQLKGDGAALGVKPINALLVMDVSGSMGMNPKMDGPDGSKFKIWYSNLSGYTFVTKMNPDTDQIGLVTYTTNAALPVPLSTNFANVKTGLKGMTAQSTTNQRMGTYIALKEMISHNADPTKTVQAIIVMTDGVYNQDGDPLARGTGTRIHTTEGSWSDYRDWYVIPALGTATDPRQNLSEYALQNKIKIYTVTFGTDIGSTSDLYKSMTAIAKTTGGEHYHADDGYQLKDVYTTIAGQLQETAGGETEINLNFGTVKINDNPGLITDYMDYEYQSGYSTYINKSNITKYGVYYPLLSETRNDTQAWHDNTMAFDVGTIKLNETWSATFRLNLTHAGKIDLFGPGSSTISFTDAATGVTQTGFIPAMQCRVKESIVNTGFGSKTLLVDHLAFVEGASPDPNVWTIKWDTTYDGDKTVQEAILYRVTGETQWKTIPGGLVFISTKVSGETKQHTVSTSDTALWPPGKCFDIQIVAGAEDANAAITNPITKCKALPGGTIFIKLE